jgi:hypothetical protein
MVENAFFLYQTALLDLAFEPICLQRCAVSLSDYFRCLNFQTLPLNYAQFKYILILPVLFVLEV